MTHVQTEEEQVLWERKRWLILTSPFLLLAFCSILLPLGLNLHHSFYSGPISSPFGRFVGVQHYRDLIADSAFWQSLLRSVNYGVSSALIQVGFALSAALVFRQLKTFSFVFRALCLVPVLVPPIAVVAVVRILFDSSYGPAQRLLKSLTGYTINPFSEGWLLLTAILLTSLQFFPLSFLLLSERIRLIPHSLYQRASLDGLGPVSTFFSVTWPEISRPLFWLFALRLCITFGKFDVLYFIGGTSALANEVETTALYVFREGFRQGHLGYAAAASVTLLAIVSIGLAVGYFLSVRFARVNFTRRTLLVSKSETRSAGHGAKLMSALTRCIGVGSILLLIVCPLGSAVLLSMSPKFLSFGEGLSLKNYEVLFNDYGFHRTLGVSLSVTVATLLLVIGATFLFAFVADVFDFPAKSTARPFAIGAYCLPAVVLAYGSQALSFGIGAFGSPAAVVGGLLGFCLPLAFVLMTSFGNDAKVVLPIQSSGERISLARYFRHVFLPNRLGALFVTASFVFAACWSDYLFAATVGGSRVRTAVVAFQDIFQGAVVPWGVLIAGALILVAPSVLISVAVEAVLRRRKYDYGI